MSGVVGGVGYGPGGVFKSTGAILVLFILLVIILSSCFC
ncbi:YjcZ family sporulation protein [Paenibacillus sp. Y412MC10]|nr:YjcZ family sporulation protein [Paenibacillus sp. Y412MC10]